MNEGASNMIKEYKHNQYQTYKYVNIEDKQYINNIDNEFDYYYSKTYNIFFKKTKCEDSNCCLSDNEKYVFLIPDNNIDYYNCVEYSYCKGSFKQIYEDRSKINEIILLLSIAKDALQEDIKKDIKKITPNMLRKYLIRDGWCYFKENNCFNKIYINKFEKIIISDKLEDMQQNIEKICLIDNKFERLFVTTLILESEIVGLE